MSARGIFFDEDDVRAAAARLQAEGYEVSIARERLQGEDDDEDHPWALTTDAPDIALELLVDEYEGWFDVEEPAPPAAAPVDLPSSPRRLKRL
ncbi:hypothetical protein [Nocardioides sp. R-C-SC26]|uniref:hypothetical protein n=1 Tax=Nocardioides sp. R-C-SC26 TaxID=2870414 RepID=UPI001E63E756|nr:hypothetical protein [Nocardioides sp. R-C-SC26]